MGDMAEYYASQDVGDYWDGMSSSDGAGSSAGYQRSPQCKYCGSTKVDWIFRSVNGWRMINLADHKPHTCKEYYDKHRSRSYYTGREIVLTEPLPEPNRTPYVPYLDWATSIVRQRDVEVARRTSRESRFAYNGHAW